MEDTYVYLSVKLYLKDGQTEDTIQEIIQECDYHFTHFEGQIIAHEIKDILDIQIPDANESGKQQQLQWHMTNSSEPKIDPFDLPSEG